jgi:hypothetical protein
MNDIQPYAEALYRIWKEQLQEEEARLVYGQQAESYARLMNFRPGDVINVPILQDLSVGYIADDNLASMNVEEKYRTFTWNGWGALEQKSSTPKGSELIIRYIDLEI